MEAFETLKDYLGTLVEIPPLQWLQLLKHLKIRKLKKGDCYIQQGEIFDEIGFVIQGLMYNSYMDPDGKEYVKAFLSEGKPVTCYSDMLRGVASSFSSTALEPTLLVTLKFSDLQKLYRTHSCWERMGRLSAEKLYIEKEQREWQFLLGDAKSRYENFVQENRGLIDRIPQYLIASYIGISPVSLSRIRKP
jgi:CRP-like cAMP-binding protein